MEAGETEKGVNRSPTPARVCGKDLQPLHPSDRAGGRSPFSPQDLHLCGGKSRSGRVLVATRELERSGDDAGGEVVEVLVAWSAL